MGEEGKREMTEEGWGRSRGFRRFHGAYLRAEKKDTARLRVRIARHNSRPAGEGRRGCHGGVAARWRHDGTAKGSGGRD